MTPRAACHLAGTVALSLALPLLAGCGPRTDDGGIPGGPGTPTLEIIAVPAYGSDDALRGQAWHVDPVAYRVLVYLEVAEGWWVKPVFASPLTRIQPDGSWSCDVTTGGIDALATRFAAFLVPTGYAPPLLAGARALPPEIAAAALAQVQAAR